ncbi:MAG: glycosyltransferase [Ruminococcaceae bacterium]|nr:glycosyltransferase [Oscillospiraceae bacterium]
MVVINLPQIAEYNATPWELSLAERLKRFYAAKKIKKVAVMLYGIADTSTFRYRCYNVAQALEKSTDWGAVYFFEKEYDIVQTLIKDADLLVLTRVKWRHSLANLIARAKANNVPVLFDVDDRVFDLDALPILTNTLAVDLSSEHALDFWFADIARIQQAASLAEGFLATNDYLGNKLHEKFSRPYQIIPNSLNDEQIRVSQRLSKEKRERKSIKPFTIGYFSGTPSHINDFLMVHKELLAFLISYPDTRLCVVGFMEFPQEMQLLIDAGRIEFIPLVDFIELQRLVAQVDVNIVPLINNSFTNCKSELKFFEAAVVDTITLATPIYSYRHSIRNGETGFLCSTGQWYDTIESIYLEKVDTNKMCDAAKEDVLKRYYGPVFMKQIENAYNSFIR